MHSEKMASKSKIGLGFLLCSLGALMLLLCLVIMQKHSVCVTGHGCYYEEMVKQNRKLLTKEEVAKTSGLHAAASSVEKGKNKMGASELRMVPSGPDPLHHNGNPKKPRSPRTHKNFL